MVKLINSTSPRTMLFCRTTRNPWRSKNGRAVMLAWATMRFKPKPRARASIPPNSREPMP